MPGSFPVFDAVVAQLISRIAPQRALDVGTGAGKYGHLLARHAPDCQRTGIEVEPSYVPQFGLTGLYDPLLVEDVTQWWRRTPAEAQAGETLFISIAAYCDPLLAFTLRSAYSQARHPARLRCARRQWRWARQHRAGAVQGSQAAR